jgi:hypothetical protein
MITVACVEWGDYLGRGSVYVRALESMVSANLRQPHRFVCFTDDRTRHPDIDTVQLTPGRTGWWNKLELFRPGALSGRILFLDLDTVVVGSLDALAASPGIIHLQDWGWKKPTYGSGVMVWDAGEHADAWICADPRRFAAYHGDQDWLTELGGWGRFPPHLARSWRYHCREAVPRDCSVVCFHGEPKPHQLQGAPRSAERLLAVVWRHHGREKSIG